MARIIERTFRAECGICPKIFTGHDETLVLNAAQEHEDKLGRPFRFNCEEDEIVFVRDGRDDDRWFMAKVLACSYNQLHQPRYTVDKVDKDGTMSDDQLQVFAGDVRKISPSFSKVDQD